MPLSPPPAPSREGATQARVGRSLRLRWLPLFLLMGALASAIPALGEPALAAARLGVMAGLSLPRLLGGEQFFPVEERLVAVAGGAYAQCAHEDKIAVGESVAIDENAWICGDVTTYGGNVIVSGHLLGAVRALEGSVTVLGEVDGDVTALGGQVALGPHAHVTGDVQAIGGKMRQETGARVDGRVSREGDLAPLMVATGYDLLGQARFSPWLLLFWALSGALFGVVLPNRLARVRAILMTQAAPNLIAGLATLMLGLLLVALFALTFIGLALAAPLALALWIAWVFGTVAVGSWGAYWLGEALAEKLGQKMNPSVAAVLGVTALGALAQLPWLGLPLALVAGSLGLGATLRLALFSRIPRLLGARC
jgi:hypothetical protein